MKFHVKRSIPLLSRCLTDRQLELKELFMRIYPCHTNPSFVRRLAAEIFAYFSLASEVGVHV